MDGGSNRTVPRFHFPTHSLHPTLPHSLPPSLYKRKSLLSFFLFSFFSVAVCEIEGLVFLEIVLVSSLRFFSIFFFWSWLLEFRPLLPKTGWIREMLSEHIYIYIFIFFPFWLCVSSGLFSTAGFLFSFFDLRHQWGWSRWCIEILLHCLYLVLVFLF